LLEKSSILNIDLLKIPSKIDDAKNVKENFMILGKIDQMTRKKI
jgi:hypothetical protein